MLSQFHVAWIWPEAQRLFSLLSLVFCKKKDNFGSKRIWIPQREQFSSFSQRKPFLLTPSHPRWSSLFFSGYLSSPAIASSRAVCPFLTESQSSLYPGTVCSGLTSHVLSLNQLPHCIAIDSELDFCSKSIEFPLARLQMVKKKIYIIPALHHY